MFGNKERQNRGLENENKMRMKGGEGYQFLRVAEKNRQKVTEYRYPPFDRETTKRKTKLRKKNITTLSYF